MKTWTVILGVLLCLSAPSSSSLPPLEEPGFCALPIGDGLHVDVYTFIVDLLEKAPSYSPEDVKQLSTREQQQENNTQFKPHHAAISEGEMATLLRLICQACSSCHGITLYQKEGVDIVASGFKNKQDLPGRPLGLRIGILDQELISKTSACVYENADGRYKEILRPIYKNKRGFAYADTSKKDPQDTLIGYVSYVRSF